MYITHHKLPASLPSTFHCKIKPATGEISYRLHVRCRIKGNFKADLDGPAGKFSLASPFSGDLKQVFLLELKLAAGQGKFQLGPCERGGAQLAHRQPGSEIGQRGAFIQRMSGRQRSRQHGDHGVAGAGDVELTKTISRRDAQLIAAAPDLLAALESAIQWAAPMRDAPRDARGEAHEEGQRQERPRHAIRPRRGQTRDPEGLCDGGQRDQRVEDVRDRCAVAPGACADQNGGATTSMLPYNYTAASGTLTRLMSRSSYANGPSCP